MTLRRRFVAQTLLVAGLVAAVSLPQVRLAGAAATIWRSGGPLMPRRDGMGDQGDAGRQGAVGRGSLFNAALGLSPELAEVGGRLNAIVGLARTTTYQPLRFARIRLRDAYDGHTEAQALSDGAGRFAFVDLAPSLYVVELMGAGFRVAAATSPIAILLGEVRARQTLLIVPVDSIVPVVFGGVTAPTASAPVGAGAASGVRTVNEGSTNAISPRN